MFNDEQFLDSVTMQVRNITEQLPLYKTLAIKTKTKLVFESIVFNFCVANYEISELGIRRIHLSLQDKAFLYYAKIVSDELELEFITLMDNFKQNIMKNLESN